MAPAANESQGTERVNARGPNQSSMWGLVQPAVLLVLSERPGMGMRSETNSMNGSTFRVNLTLGISTAGSGKWRRRATSLRSGNASRGRAPVGELIRSPRPAAERSIKKPYPWRIGQAMSNAS